MQLLFENKCSSIFWYQWTQKDPSYPLVPTPDVSSIGFRDLTGDPLPPHGEIGPKRSTLLGLSKGVANAGGGDDLPGSKNLEGEKKKQEGKKGKESKRRERKGKGRERQRRGKGGKYERKK